MDAVVKPQKTSTEGNRSMESMFGTAQSVESEKRWMDGLLVYLAMGSLKSGATLYSR